MPVSLFAALSFTGMLLLVPRPPARAGNLWLATLAFALAAATRSNGLLLAGAALGAALAGSVAC